MAQGLFEGGIFEAIKNRAPWNRKNLHNANSLREKEASAGDITRLSDYDVYKIISNVRDTNNNYKDKYMEYRAMAEDDVISSALEMYADDSTQMDTDTSRRITVVSKSVNLRKDIEAFLDSMDIDNRLWDWSYQMSMLGDKYVKVIRDKKGMILYLEDVDDPSEILDLHYMGARVNFAREVPEEERRSTMQQQRHNQIEYEFYPPDSYVHFMIRSTGASDKFFVEVNNESGPTSSEIREYKVIRGTSIIEKARASHRILTLLEDSMLAARVAKAEYFRIYNVEVGANSTPADARKTIAKVKNMFDSKSRIDIKSGKYESAKVLRPVGDPIFNPVREGKGSIDHSEVGGDFEVKSLVDIDYFTNKKFSTLKVPKAMLGFDDGNLTGGGLGDTTLMMQDMRYARSVKKVTSALAKGIKDLINLWLKSLGRVGDVDNFEVILTSPSSSEELMRLKELELRIDTADKVIGLSRDFGEFIDLPGLTSGVLELVSNYPELHDVMTKYYDDASDRWNTANSSTEDELSDYEEPITPSEMSDEELLNKVLSSPELISKILDNINSVTAESDQ